MPLLNFESHHTGSPEDVEKELIREDLTNMSGVAGVHSLNIWSLTMDKNVVSVHLSVGQCFITLLNYQITILHAYAKINAVKVRIVQSHEQVLCFTDSDDFRGRSVW